METLLIFAIIIGVLVLMAKSKATGRSRTESRASSSSDYRYTKKPYIMTEFETNFYRRLQKIVDGRYVIFPQIHLSSLATNNTTGRYRKAGFQRINRRSVDYVLADTETLKAVYAVELDDRTHDTQKGRAIDALKSDILAQAQIPLVRFRNVQSMSDEDIIQSFRSANSLELTK